MFYRSIFEDTNQIRCNLEFLWRQFFKKKVAKKQFTRCADQNQFFSITLEILIRIV
jgi:hypothetical protein